VQRSFEIEIDAKVEAKHHYWFRLESESSPTSADDTESIYSIQGKETGRLLLAFPVGRVNNEFFLDIVRDTTDTVSNSSEYEIDIEYEIDSLSDGDRSDVIFLDSSDESEVS
jgi:hypothetical protein